MREKQRANPRASNWKHAIFASNDWPRNLNIPQADAVPQRSRLLMAGEAGNGHWRWQLWEGPDREHYFLRVRNGIHRSFSNGSALAVVLTLGEALQFVAMNWSRAA